MSKQQLQARAQRQQDQAKFKHKQERQAMEKQAKPMDPKILLPPKQPKGLSQGLPGDQGSRPKFCEYRRGLLQAGTLAMSRTLESDKQQPFIESVATSKDLMALIDDVEMIQWLDQLNGIPKLCLTLGSKYMSAKYF